MVPIPYAVGRIGRNTRTIWLKSTHKIPLVVCRRLRHLHPSQKDPKHEQSTNTIDLFYSMGGKNFPKVSMVMPERDFCLLLPNKRSAVVDKCPLLHFQGILREKRNLPHFNVMIFGTTTGQLKWTTLLHIQLTTRSF